MASSGGRYKLCAMVCSVLAAFTLYLLLNFTVCCCVELIFEVQTLPCSSIFLPGNSSISCFTDIQVKELNKRASGQAFEVILSPSTPDAKVDFLLSPLKKKETSLDEIKRKLDAAEERRRVSRLTAGFISRHKEKKV